MTCNTLIDNQTKVKIQGVEELIEGFLEQLNFKTNTEVSVVFCDNKTMQNLNYQYRNINKTTDVLSFCQNLDYFLGDIVVSVPQALEQAENGLAHEIETLLAHGLLHLLGYDHEKSEKDFETMLNLQNQLIKNKKRGLNIL